MAARTTIADGARYCTGHCGRRLPLGMFYRNGRGYPNTECRACVRVASRVRRQVKVRSKAGRAFKAAEAARARASYWARKAAA